MSNDDYTVDPLSNAEVHRNAKELRRFLGLADAERIDLQTLEEITKIWTVRGVKPFRLETVADADLQSDSGLTTYDGSSLLIRVPRRIRHKAFLGDGYARFTIGHEFGHATQHLNKLMQGAAMPRRQMGNVSPGWIPKFKSAEHQANVFGAAFLINDRSARLLSSPEEISVQAGVSLQAARIFFEQIQEEMARATVASQIRQLAKQIGREPPTLKAPTFLKQPCSVCGQQKLFPVGHKYMCQACDTVYDRFQDGDPVD